MRRYKIQHMIDDISRQHQHIIMMNLTSQHNKFTKEHRLKPVNKNNFDIFC